MSLVETCVLQMSLKRGILMRCQLLAASILAAVTLHIARSASAQRPRSYYMCAGPSMWEYMRWRCHVVLLLLSLHGLLQTFAARPEDAVFIPGTLPPTDDGKQVVLTPAHLECIFFSIS